MKLLSPAQTASLLRFSPRSGGGVEEGAAVFTLFEIEQVVGEGRIGPEGEEEPARRVKRPARIGEGEKDGCWELAAGVYLARVNERLEIPPGALLLLQPHPALVANGVWHLPLVLRSDRELERGLMLVVGAKGVRIRENAPVSLGIVVA